jgi:ketosteroid isomerase-like protein
MSSVARFNVSPDDLSRLLQLNQDYIDAVRTSDVDRFREILGEDFLCTMADGTLVDRAAFLEHASRPTTALGIQAHDVKVRLFGDMAIVHAATAFTYPDGRHGRGRYTDVWARRNGNWVAVAAQFARQ